ncbi:hypothetical protein NUACC21_20500 [Scytonema sp. NUACC21]
MVNIGYHSARIQGQVLRSLYKALLVNLVNTSIEQTRKVPINVYALSCERDLPEQVVSIRSFIRYIGIPDTFTVISDGSYTDASRDLLCRIHPCVKVMPIEELIRADIPKCVTHYAQLHPMGKKLSALMSIPVNGTTIYTDSDILFFPGGIDLLDIVYSDDKYNRYLPDCANSLDKRILYEADEILNPINAGFIVFKHELDWSFATERLAYLREPPGYFTEQTIVHLTIHKNHGKPLCKERYVLSVEDQFIYPDKFASKEIALRHYVRDVRHKFWLNAGLYSFS